MFLSFQGFKFSWVAAFWSYFWKHLRQLVLTTNEE